MACQFGVTNFVVPGTKLDWVQRIRGWIVEEIGEGNFSLFAPGFITQGGDISECGKVAGDSWHAIVGSAIYGKSTDEEQRQAAMMVTQKISTNVPC
jgi:orotidine-5'-phosphate decarboxylase